jgi:hypothetical protein
MMSWKRLEENLTWLVSFLQTSPAPLLSLFEEMFPLPHKFGYLRDHATKKFTASCIKRSHDVFLPLMAHYSYLLFWHNFEYQPLAILKDNKLSTDIAKNSLQLLTQTKGSEPPVAHWEFVLSKVGTTRYLHSSQRLVVGICPSPTML